MASKRSLLFAAIMAGSAALPTSSAVIHEKRSLSGQSGLVNRQRVDAAAILPLRIGLLQSNLEDGYAHLMDVSHPSSANYGKHWTTEAVDTIFAPSNHSVAAVKEWLTSSGIESDDVFETEKGWLAIDLPAGDAERLLNTEYYEHEAEDGTLRIGCDQYHLPQHISAHIDYIRPGVALSPPLAKKNIKRDLHSSSWGRYISHPNWPGRWGHSDPWDLLPHDLQLAEDLRSCGTNMTPICIRALYDIPKAYRNDSENSLGIYENAGLDVYSQEDIDAFFAKYAPYVPQGSHPVLDSIDNATAPVAQNSKINTGESDIDLDIAFSLLYPQVSFVNVTFDNRLS